MSNRKNFISEPEWSGKSFSLVWGVQPFSFSKLVCFWYRMSFRLIFRVTGHTSSTLIRLCKQLLVLQTTCQTQRRELEYGTWVKVSCNTLSVCVWKIDIRHEVGWLRYFEFEGPCWRLRRLNGMEESYQYIYISQVPFLLFLEELTLNKTIPQCHQLQFKVVLSYIILQVTKSHQQNTFLFGLIWGYLVTFDRTWPVSQIESNGKQVVNRTLFARLATFVQEDSRLYKKNPLVQTRSTNLQPFACSFTYFLESFFALFFTCLPDNLFIPICANFYWFCYS